MAVKKTNKEKKLNILLVTVCIVLPILFFIVYELIAGGVFNSFAGGTYKKGIVDGSSLVGFIYPIVILGFYGLLVYEFSKFSREMKRTPRNISLMIVATIVTLLVIFWKVLTA